MSEIRAEHTFEVDRAPGEAWRLLQRVRAEHMAPDAPGDQWWLPGFTCRCTELSCEPGRQVTVRKDEEPCAGTTISVTIEHAGSGSRISVVQSGFDPAFVDAAGESFWLHASHIFADVELYLRTGALGGRAWRWPSVDLGFAASSADTSVVVDAVRDDSWATQVGLAAGDALLTLNGASLYGFADLATVRQTVRPDTDVSVTFARGSSVHHASAAI